MGNYTIFYMFQNPRRGRQARNFTTNVPKILDLKSSSEKIFFQKLTLDALESIDISHVRFNTAQNSTPREHCYRSKKPLIFLSYCKSSSFEQF